MTDYLREYMDEEHKLISFFESERFNEIIQNLKTYLKNNSEFSETSIDETVCTVDEFYDMFGSLERNLEFTTSDNTDFVEYAGLVFKILFTENSVGKLVISF